MARISGTECARQSYQTGDPDSASGQGDWNGRSVTVCCGLSPLAAKTGHVTATIILTLASLATIAILQRKIGLEGSMLIASVVGTVVFCLLSSRIGLEFYDPPDDSEEYAPVNLLPIGAAGMMG